MSRYALKQDESPTPSGAKIQAEDVRNARSLMSLSAYLLHTVGKVGGSDEASYRASPAYQRPTVAVQELSRMFCG